MNEMTSTIRPTAMTLAVAALAAVMLVMSGCHRARSSDEQAAPPAAEPAARNAPAESEAEEGVSLTPQEIEAMGIVTAEARAIQSSPEVPGFGVVLAHEIVATAVAEIRTAAAAERQSHAALERSRKLAGTPGAMPAETQDAAEKQSVADQAALELARQRLSSTFGQNPPWKTSENSPELLSLASGHSKLVHVTFPLGSLGETDPSQVRLARIDSSQGGRSWQSDLVWHAPADATVPGRSYFAILKNSAVGEGDHLLAWAPVGEAEAGVLVPASAAVINAGKFYCYVEKRPGTFVRTEFDPGRPTADGYFAKDGIREGEKIVTAAAGQLLARESNPSREAE